MPNKSTVHTPAQVSLCSLLFLACVFCLSLPVKAWHRSVNLTGTSNRLLAAEGGTGTGISARSGATFGINFTLLDLNEGRLMHGDPVSFRTFKGSFIFVGNDNVVRAGSGTTGGTSTFIIEKRSGDHSTEITNGDTIALRTANRRFYVRLNAAGRLVATRFALFGPGANGAFTLAVLGNPPPFMLSGPFTIPQSIAPFIFGVDNNPSPSASDPDTECTNYLGQKYPTCYKGHRGTDYPLLGSFPQMGIANLTVAAVAPGKVVAVMDGNPDHCTKILDPPMTPGGPPTPRVVCLDAPTSMPFHNFVTVLQDDGLLAYYFHLQKGTTAVSVGQRVACGQLIGRIGSSGDSVGPHLHLELSLLRPTDTPPRFASDYFSETTRARPGAAVDPYLLSLWTSMFSSTIPAKTCAHPSTSLVSTLGQSCAGLFETCASGLTCDPLERVCKLLNVGLGGACDNNMVCGFGLNCRDGKCKRLGVLPGGACDENQLCGDPLTCQNGTCKLPTVPLGGACDFPGPLCDLGLSCENKVCKRVGVVVGGACDENQLCSVIPPLECRGETCRLPCACLPPCFPNPQGGQCVRGVTQTVRKDCRRVKGVCPWPGCFIDSSGACKMDVQELRAENCSLTCP